MKSRYRPRRKPYDASYECLACEHEWRGYESDERRCPACFSSQVEHLNVTHPEELLLPAESSLPAGVPQVLPNSEIYFMSERREPPRGRWRVRPS